LLYAYGFSETYLVLTLVTLAAFALVFAFLRDNPGGRKDPEDAGGIETFRSLLGLPLLRALVFFRFTFSVGKMAVII
ncbi:MFS transporter, partial [Halorubrum sp. SP9]